MLRAGLSRPGPSVAPKPRLSSRPARRHPARRWPKESKGRHNTGDDEASACGSTWAVDQRRGPEKWRSTGLLRIATTCAIRGSSSGGGGGRGAPPAREPRWWFKPPVIPRIHPRIWSHLSPKPPHLCNHSVPQHDSWGGRFPTCPLE